MAYMQHVECAVGEDKPLTLGAPTGAQNTQFRESDYSVHSVCNVQTLARLFSSSGAGGAGMRSSRFWVIVRAIRPMATPNQRVEKRIRRVAATAIFCVIRKVV